MSTEQTPGTDSKGGRPRQPAWIAGGVLILAGAAFLISNVAGVSFDNWWALFILIPALGSLVTAYQIFERNDRKFTAASRGPLVGGLVLLAVTAVFLFDLDWGKIWPLFLILAGGGMLLTSFQKKS